MIDTERYEEMISTLNQYLSDANNECDAMSGAAADLSDNRMEGDAHAVELAGALSSCVNGIRGALEGVSSIISGLQQELNDALSA